MVFYQHNLGFKVVQKEIVTIKPTYDTTQVSRQARFNISNRVAAVEKQCHPHTVECHSPLLLMVGHLYMI